MEGTSPEIVDTTCMLFQRKLFWKNRHRNNRQNTSTPLESGTADSPQQRQDAAAQRKNENPRRRQKKKPEELEALKKTVQDMNLLTVVKTPQELFQNVDGLKQLVRAIERVSGDDEMWEVSEQAEANKDLPVELVAQSSALCGEFFMKVGDGFKRTSDYVSKIFDSQNDIVTAVSKTFGHMGQLHWAGLVLSGVAFALRNWQQLEANKDRLRKNINSLLRLGYAVVKVVEGGLEDPSEHLKSTIQTVVGCIFDCIQESIIEIESSSARKFFFGNLSKDLLDKHEKQIHNMVTELILAAILQKKPDISTSLSSTSYLPEYSMTISGGVEFDEIVGIQDSLGTVKEMLKFVDAEEQRIKIRAVVIHGMGGIGKSTLGRSLCQSISDRYMACVLDMSPPNTVEMLQDELLLKFTGKEFSSASKDIRRQMLAHCFNNLRKPVFLFVDNVENVQDDCSLEMLLPEKIIRLLPAGSRLLVASRISSVRKSLGRIGIDQVEVFEMALLDKDSSKRLLRYHMLRNSNAELPVGFNQYEEQILETCDGLPLALEVIGSYLNGEEDNKGACESVIEALEESVPPDGSSDRLNRALKFSYDRLDPVSQQVFLDISFCLNLSSWGDLKSIYRARLDILRDRSVVKKEVELFKDSGLRFERVKVHSCFVALCRKIAVNLGTHIRIDGSRDSWNFEQVPQVLVLEGGCRGGYQVVQAAELDKKLRFLRVLIMTDVKFRGNCQQVPSKLNCLYCNHSNVPFPLGNLENLKVIDISTAVDTEYKIPRGVRRLRLDAPSLMKLRFPLDSELRELGLMFCPQLQLQTEQASFPCLEKLVLRHGTHIRTLPTQFTRLQSVSIQNCISFHLPRNFSGLKALEHLHISSVRELVDLPENLSRFEKLISLTLEDCPFLEKLPKDMGNSPSFQLLEVKHCPNLSLPDNIHSWVQDKQDPRDSNNVHRIDNMREESSYSSRWVKGSGNAEELKEKATAAKYMIPLIRSRGAFDRLSELVYELYSEDDPDVEIVFLPGISTTMDNREAHWRTWRRKDREECWLQTLLPEVLKDQNIRARILTVSYESLLNNTLEPEELVAKAMIRDLILHPESGVGQKHDVPVILVAHGLGGIVIKCFLRAVIQKIKVLEDDDGTRTNLKRFCTNLKAFVFYSTPMSGSPAMERLAESIQEDSPERMLRLVKVLSSEMAVVNEYIAKERRRLGIKSFALCEVNETNQGDYENENVVVVPEASVRQDVDQLLPVQEDHYGITQAEDIYSTSVGFLAQIVEDIVEEVKNLSTA